MPYKGTCKICTNKKIRASVDNALLRGVSVRNISIQNSVAEATIRHHRDKHLIKNVSRVTELVSDALDANNMYGDGINGGSNTSPPPSPAPAQKQFETMKDIPPAKRSIRNSQKDDGSSLPTLGDPIDNLSGQMSMLYNHGLTRMLDCYNSSNEILELKWFSELRSFLSIVVKGKEYAALEKASIADISEISIKVLNALKDHPESKKLVADALIKKG